MTIRPKPTGAKEIGVYPRDYAVDRNLDSFVVQIDDYPDASRS
jgi:hypothetical protein